MPKHHRYPASALLYLNEYFVVKLECKVIRKSMFNVVKNLESLMTFIFASACNDIVEESSESVGNSEERSKNSSSLDSSIYTSRRRTQPRNIYRRKDMGSYSKKGGKVPFNVRGFQNKSRYIRTCMGGLVDIMDSSLYGKDARVRDRDSQFSFGNETQVGLGAESSIYELNSQLKGLVALFEQPYKGKLGRCVTPVFSEVSENVLSQLKKRDDEKLSMKKKKKRPKKIIPKKKSSISSGKIEEMETSPKPLPDREKIENLRIRGVRSEPRCLRSDGEKHVSYRISSITKPRKSVEKSVLDGRMQNRILLKRVIEENEGKLAQERNKVKCNFRNFVAVNFGRRYQLKCSLSRRDKYLSTLITAVDAKAKGFKRLKWISLATHQKKVSRDRNIFIETLKEQQKNQPMPRGYLYRYGVCDTLSAGVGLSTIEPKCTNSLISLASLQRQYPDVIYPWAIKNIGFQPSIPSDKTNAKYKKCLSENSSSTSIPDHHTYILNVEPPRLERSCGTVDIISYFDGEVPLVDLRYVGTVDGYKANPEPELSRVELISQFSEFLDIYIIHLYVYLEKLYFCELMDLLERDRISIVSNDWSSSSCNIVEYFGQTSTTEIDNVLQKDGASNQHTTGLNLQPIRRQKKAISKKRRSRLRRNQLKLQQLYCEPTEDALNYGVIPLDGRAQLEYQLDQRLKRIREEAKSFIELLEDLKQYALLSKIVKLSKLKERSQKVIPDEPIRVKQRLFPHHTVYQVKGKLKNSINEDFDETFNTIIVAGKHMCPAQDINFHDIGVKTCYFNGKIHTNYLDQTTVPTVYSIGDCVYGWPFENYGSVIAAQYLVRRLFTDFDESPEIQISIKSVQTYPHQLAFIGLSEEEARKRYRNVTTYTGSFKSFTNQWFVKNEAPSTLKFVCHMESPEMEKVVGIHFYNEHASNIIQGYSVAMKNGLYYNEVQDLLAICPPSTECVYQFNMERKEYENLEVHEDLQSYIFESNSSLDTRSISSYADSEYASREDFIPAEVSESWKISDGVVPYNSYISEDTGSFKEGSAFIDIEDEEHSVSYIIPYEELNEEQETTPEEEQQIDFINTEKKGAVSGDGTGNDGCEQMESSLCSAYRSKSYTTGTSEAQFMSIYTPSPTEGSYSLGGEAYDYGDFVGRDGCAVKDVIDRNTSDEERDCKKQSSSSEESSNSFRTATCYSSASSVMSEIPSANVTCDPNFERFSAQTLNVSESTSVGLEAEELIDEGMSVEELSEEESRAEEPSSGESSSGGSSLTDRVLRFDAPGMIVHFCFDLFQDYKEYQYNEDVPLTQQGRCTISSTCPYFSNHGRSVLQSPIGSSSLIPLLDGEFCYSTTERNSDLNESSLLHILESEGELVESRSYKDIDTCDVKLQSLDKSKRRHNGHDMIPPLAPQHDNEEPVCFSAGQSNQFTIDCSDSSGPSDDSIIFVPPPTVQESIPGHEMLRKPSTKYPPRALVEARSISGGEDFTRYVYTSGYRSFTDSDESFSDPESVGAVAGSSTLDNLGSAASIHNNHPIQQSITQNLSFLSTTAQRVLGRWLFPNSLAEDNKSENKN